MPKPIVVKDQNKLVPTKRFPKYAKFPFEEFNPVQSRIFEFYNEDCNAIIAAATSAGKTVCAEMIIANEIRERGGKAVYLAPLKALAKEKIDDWTDENHHFYDLNLSICTGDYKLTVERRKELEKANVILMTSEMLSSRTRNFKSEQNEWLKDVKTLVVDESHLLTVPGRGDHLEVGLMKFTKLSPECRIVFLSATMPNVGEIAEWVSYVLTGKKTYLLQSEFRPCPLAISYESYDDEGYYDDVENTKARSVLQIVRDYPDDKFLVFTHTKRTGQLVKKLLIQAGINCDFHNADLEKAARHKLEDKFRNRDLSVLAATSSLAWGLNMPARRVIITGIHRGLAEVASYDIIQMCGRAGRPGYDPRGDVYILLPESEFKEQRDRICAPSNITSRLLDHDGRGPAARYKILAFHIVSEIHRGNIKTEEDIEEWYKRSLASFQAQDLDDNIIDLTIQLLENYGAIRKDENGNYRASAVGMVSSLLYYSPFDVADLRKNFHALFNSKFTDNDIVISMCLGSVDSLRIGIVSRLERVEISDYKIQVIGQFGASKYNEAEIKGGFAYHSLMNGNNLGAVSSTGRSLQFDFSRLIQVLKMLDGMSGKWGQHSWFDELKLRVQYGVGVHLIDLCKIPNIGKVRAEKLWAAGLRSPTDVAINFPIVQRVLNMKKESIEEICQNAAKR